MQTTAPARQRVGTCLLFDPTGSASPSDGVQSVGWTPLQAARNWDGALGTAAAMVAASQRRSSSGGSVDHWSERAGSLLATLLYAAVQAEVGIDAVVQWSDRHHGHDALEILTQTCGDGHPASALLTGILATDSREQSGIWSTTSGVLGAYRSLGVRDATRSDLLDVNEFVDGSHTLYICAPGRTQALVAPLVVGLLNEIQAAGYRRNDTERPLLFALDELANIAPLPDLPQLVSEGGGQGVLTIGCLQDLSQARSRWGPEADGFLSLFSTTLLLGGVADIRTLRAFSELSGHHEVLHSQMGSNRDAKGRRTTSTSISHQRQERLGIDSVAQGQPGRGLVLDAQNQLGWIDLSPAYRDEPWRSLIATREQPHRERDR